jgi:predicted small metal-binding protein
MLITPVKKLIGRDLGIQCRYVATGITEEQVIRDTEKHLKKYHRKEYDRLKPKLYTYIKDA